jgi:hypothetical protein
MELPRVSFERAHPKFLPFSWLVASLLASLAACGAAKVRVRWYFSLPHREKIDVDRAGHSPH